MKIFSMILVIVADARMHSCKIFWLPKPIYDNNNDISNNNRIQGKPPVIDNIPLWVCIFLYRQTLSWYRCYTIKYNMYHNIYSHTVTQSHISYLDIIVYILGTAKTVDLFFAPFIRRRKRTCLTDFSCYFFFKHFYIPRLQRKKPCLIFFLLSISHW